MRFVAFRREAQTKHIVPGKRTVSDAPENFRGGQGHRFPSIFEPCSSYEVPRERTTSALPRCVRSRVSKVMPITMRKRTTPQVSPVSGGLKTWTWTKRCSTKLLFACKVSLRTILDAQLHNCLRYRHVVMIESRAVATVSARFLGAQAFQIHGHAHRFA